MVRFCPLCGSHKLGLIGLHRYFCADCCHEFVFSQRRQEAYYPGENGDIRKTGPIPAMKAGQESLV